MDNDQEKDPTIPRVNFWILAGPSFSSTQLAFGGSQDHRPFFQIALLPCFQETRYRENLVGSVADFSSYPGMLMSWMPEELRGNLSSAGALPGYCLDLEIKTPIFLPSFSVVEGIALPESLMNQCSLVFLI